MNLLGAILVTFSAIVAIICLVYVVPCVLIACDKIDEIHEKVCGEEKETP